MEEIMTKTDIAQMLKEVRSIGYYRKRVQEVTETCKEISRQIIEVGTPHCPLGNTGPAVQNHIPQSSRILELIGEEQFYSKWLRHYKNALIIAEGYRAIILAHTQDDNERAFVSEFIESKNYRYLEQKYGYSNAYSQMRTIIKRCRFSEMATERMLGDLE